MKRFISTIAVAAILLAAIRSPAQTRWPVTIAGQRGVLEDLHKPTIVAYDRDVLQFKSVISVRDGRKMEPVFGMVWVTARVELDSTNGWIAFQRIRIDYLTMPEDTNRRDMGIVEKDLMTNIGVLKTLPMADLTAFNAAVPTSPAVDSVAMSAGLQTIDSLEVAALKAQVPQMVRVKFSAKTAVVYTGTPQFEQIPGTRLDYATNSSQPVFRLSADRYYTLANGVWFESWSPTDHWVVALDRPADVSMIPRDHPAYPAQLVDVYSYGNGFVWDGRLGLVSANRIARNDGVIARRARRWRPLTDIRSTPGEYHQTSEFEEPRVRSFYETFVPHSAPGPWPTKLL